MVCLGEVFPKFKIQLTPSAQVLKKRKETRTGIGVDVNQICRNIRNKPGLTNPEGAKWLQKVRERHGDEEIERMKFSKDNQLEDLTILTQDEKEELLNNIDQTKGTGLENMSRKIIQKILWNNEDINFLWTKNFWIGVRLRLRNRVVCLLKEDRMKYRDIAITDTW